MPLWKVVAKLGFKLRLRVVAKYDHDSMSYYGNCKLFGTPT